MGVIQPLCLVQVVDHDGREQQDAGVVEERDRHLVVQPEHRQQRRGQGHEDEPQQAPEQRRPPHGEVLGHERSNQSGQEDHASGDGQGLDDAAELVEADERSDHETHGAGADEATDDGRHRVVVRVSQHCASDRDRHAGDQEEDVEPAVRERPAVAERSAE